MVRPASGAYASMRALSFAASSVSFRAVYWCSNASYIGALVFVLNAVISLVGWRAYRHEVTEMIGFERQLLPGKCSSDGGSAGARRCCCRGCSTIDWLGLAGIIFLAGAALDLVDEFVDDPSAQSWVRTVHSFQCCRKAHLSSQ
jgi:hypothetical protein